MGDQHYRCFVQKKNGKERDIEEPLPKLRKVHCRIASLLCRIEVFDGLHSGRKGRSNISNALAHLGDNRNAITCDITKFYPTTRRTHIFDFFYNTMECSPDVADLLSKLVSYEEHIPTGSQISMPLAYFSNKRMFDEIEAAASSTQSVLTIFVDDLTISGPNLQKSFIKELERIVEKHGHKINRSKTRFYSSSDIKLITGAAIDGNSIFPRNKHLKALQDDLSEWFETPTKKAKPISRILGRMTFIGSIEP
ncbi:MAG: reverse transcriptase family protein, partial [Gammaproteobacteria bacterium]|nr:reverse transcriptase family protein [Gammaproteobacteria bacterium]